MYSTNYHYDETIPKFSIGWVFIVKSSVDYENQHKTSTLVSISGKCLLVYSQRKTKTLQKHIMNPIHIYSLRWLTILHPERLELESFRFHSFQNLVFGELSI